MPDGAKDLLDNVMATLSAYGLSVVGALAILVLGWSAAGWASRSVRGALGRAKRIDPILHGFLASLIRYVVIAITVLAVLNQFGVQTTSLVALLGAAGLAVGLALQGTLSNVAAGVMLLIFRPFKVGDFIEAGGGAGIVDSLNLFVTELHTPDNVHMVLPNGDLWNKPIKNYSHHATRRVEVAVGIDYKSSIDQAIAAIRSVIDADSRVLREPEPLVAVNGLGDNSVNLIARAWCAAADFWPVRFDLTKRIKERLDAEGITIPFPQRTVHLAREESASAPRG